MSATFHLPAAVDQTSRSLAGLSTHRLIAMRAECEAWREEMSQFQDALVSPSARILWTALCAGEVPVVADAERRVASELAGRTYGLGIIAA